MTSPASAESERDRGQNGTTGSRPQEPDPEDHNVGLGLLDESMGPSSALAHLYRGEVHRMKLWRERLDRTTNWAVLLLAAIVTWAFSNPSNPHYVLLIGNLAVGLFLVIEARRYRAYDMWRSRVRTLQRNVFAPGLDPTRPPEPSWRARLAADYRNPTMKITAEEGIAHRLRRVYLPLFALLDAAWVLRVTAFGVERWPASAAIGPIPGVLVTLGLVAVFGAAVFIALRARIWRAHDELRTEDIRSPHE